MLLESETFIFCNGFSRGELERHGVNRPRRSRTKRRRKENVLFLYVVLESAD